MEANKTLGLALPKGRMQKAIFALLAEAGLGVEIGARQYRPRLPVPDIDTKLLKPQNVVEMLHAGTRHVGFAGADWVAELDCSNLVELLDTGLDRVTLVAAAAESVLEDGKLPARRIVVASECERLTGQWIEARGFDDGFVRSYGATEVFPPEDADCVIDITATGATLAANRLTIVDELMVSSTRFYASERALQDAGLRARIDDLVMLLRSVLDARRRVMLEVNVTGDRLEAVVEVLPCMREPTIAQLHEGQGYAVKAAVPKDQLPTLIPELKSAGATDLVVQKLDQIIP